MGKRLYVGNLPFALTEQELQTLFNPHGQVANTKLITDKYSGRSKGFGFVEMSSDDEAQTAVDKMNGSDVGGRRIIVDNARPMRTQNSG